MKAVMYISQAVNEGTAPWMPYDYAALTKATHANNVKNEITGILSYQDGYFLQYVEGDDETIDDLIIKVASDKRHENLQILLSQTLSNRKFTKWSMPMGNKLRKNEEFQRLTRLFRLDFHNLTPAIQDVLNKFYDFGPVVKPLAKESNNMIEAPSISRFFRRPKNQISMSATR